jgi:signal transduction histidine kinase
MENSILLVDDEPGIRKVMEITLADRGYIVHTAENGQEALRLFKKITPPIVLTDIKMPDMDGIELLQRIKRLIPDTEVIMFTGHGDMDLAIKSLKHEATDFVTKPINDDVLEIALKRAHEKISMRKKLREYTENLEKLVEEKARKLVEAERLAAIGQTVSELSHTIKNIANGLKGSIFVLEKGIELDNKKYLLEGWKMAEGNLEKIKDLSLDLLDYGKYAEVDFRMCHPNKPAKEVVALMQSRALEQAIHLQLELHPDLQPFCFNPEAIHRCLLNLVTNAIEAFADMNSLAEKKKVLLKTLPAEGWGVEYRIIDNGSGMDENLSRRIFQSFFSTKGTQGTGIGLMMTKKIVDQHSGEIQVISKKGTGSTFTIRLPRKTESAA